jgi:hypothetical protein
MEGFTMAERTATIEFTEYPGKAFHVLLSPIPMDDYFDLAEKLDGFSDLRELRDVFNRFHAVAFRGWDGYDTEPTADNLRQLDMNLLLGIMRQWIVGVSKVPLPLPVASGAGGRSKARRASKSRSR